MTWFSIMPDNPLIITKLFLDCRKKLNLKDVFFSLFIHGGGLGAELGGSPPTQGLDQEASLQIPHGTNGGSHLFFSRFSKESGGELIRGKIFSSVFCCCWTEAASLLPNSSFKSFL
ncbi:hypothetical protein CHARACLAT_018576 [Characodon lateralis]|uniref:Uncharacterized protein n=1 Tax=Characodon lateralis TaxID=208331 RepID=A0ABU7CP90_9TELE|nr:hypothetical protein [Characodon lateralis]